MLDKIKKYLIPSFMMVYSTTAISWIFIRIIFSNHELFGKYIYANRLINYRAGFIRRGLGGEIIFWLSRITGLSLVSVIDMTSAIIWISLVVFFIHEFIRKKYPLFILTLPFFLGETIIVDDQYFLRQDSFTILIFIAMVYIAIKNRIPEKLSFFLINLLFVFGTLFHEAIFFISFPILLLTIWHKKNSIITSFLFLLPSLIVFILCFLLPEKSTPTEMLKLTPEINPEYTKFLYYSIAENFSILWSRANDPSIVATIMYLLSLIFLIYFISLNFNKLFFRIPTRTPEFNINFLSLTLILQFFSVLPLFCSAWDWGRWCFLWTASSFAYFLLAEENPFNKNIMQKFDISQMKWFQKLSEKQLLVFLAAILTSCRFSIPLRADFFTFSPVFIIFRTILENINHSLTM
jgi:hypothetical protein